MKKILTLCVALSFQIQAQVQSKETQPSSNIKERQYTGFRLIMDCSLRAPVLFEQVISRDNSKLHHRSSYFLDPGFDADCQQRSVGQYKESFKRIAYTRGQLVAPESIDITKNVAMEAFNITNVIPMSTTLKDGGWKFTNEFQECERDISDILVVGGAIYNNKQNDIFRLSHGVATPDYLWKVVFFSDKHAAWLFPNNNYPTYKNANNYLVPLSKIEKMTGYRVFGKQVDKDYVPSERFVTVKRKPRCNLT
ncbi:hypothetical protein UA32_12180 [Photobacterium angustum]|uniref:DNA/RNA non-specific endonuclease n=1 Tax=Photobacterium angustum TaxID=661 RepID=A0ABX5GZJ4_PHOAN|nr:DNA/RNA non-specific endonuclease [Photobacterium angustum]KJG37713.1 hypothetical protein UA32_12180 [Photobacterium angustum]PSX03955.1 DNA/RNA non-specific endonuclease [Photobacterium angustum]